VLEIHDSESAENVRARLDKAAKDGFFLVNVVGRLAFLRTSITQKKDKAVDSIRKQRGRVSDLDGKDAAARDIIRGNSNLTVRALMKLLSDNGIKRGKTWVCEARLAIRDRLKCPPPLSKHTADSAPFITTTPP